MLLIVVAPVLVVTPFFAWRYRYGGSARYTPKWSFSWPHRHGVLQHRAG
jgi:cytochrome o ubiquinol oxidase subunit II